MMAEENKIRDAADAVKGIVEAVPIYQDTLQPASKEVGTALQTVAKAIHMALAPLSAMVWGYEKISDYLEKSLTEKLKGVPPERIVTPNPAIAGPALESLRYTAQEQELRQLYANLLASSMDSKTADVSHPAFVEVIRQMTPDEARLAKFLLPKSWYPAVRSVNGNRKEGLFGVSAGHRKLVLDAGVRWDWIRSGLDNLVRLGLIRVEPENIPMHIVVTKPERKFYVDILQERSYESYKQLGLDLMEECEVALRGYGDNADLVTSFDVQIETLHTTALGSRFYIACIKEQEAAG